MTIHDDDDCADDDDFVGAVDDDNEDDGNYDSHLQKPLHTDSEEERTSKKSINRCGCTGENICTYCNHGLPH